MVLCPNMRLIMTTTWGSGHKNLDMIHVRCKQWSCPYCSPVNARQWRDYILKRLNRSDFTGLSWTFLTITAHENTHKQGPVFTLKNLQRGWKKLYKRLVTYNGGPFNYLRVFERHMEGAYGGYHMHIIASIGEAVDAAKMAFLGVLAREKIAKAQGKRPRKRLKREKTPQRWLKDTCRYLRMGFEVDLKQIGSMVQKTASYMTKYIGKQLEILTFPPRMRRIQSNRKFGSPKTKKKHEVGLWRPKSAIYKSDFEIYEVIRDMTLKRDITLIDDFSHGESFYPPDMN